MIWLNVQLTMAMLSWAYFIATDVTKERLHQSTDAICIEEQARAFDFWTGHWTADIWSRPFADTPEFRKTGHLRSIVKSYLGGCLIVEYVRLHSSDQTDSAPLPGYSARFYDNEQQQWRAVLLWPDNHSSQPYEMTGLFQHGRAEFFRTLKRSDDSQLLVRFSFSDIGPNSLRWDSAVASESWSPVDFDRQLASTWFTESKFEFHRADASKPFLHPQETCSQNPITELKKIEGTWSDKNTDRSLHFTRSVGGCAWEVRLGKTAHNSEHYIFMAYDTAAGRWTYYSFSPGTLNTGAVEIISSDSHEFIINDEENRFSFRWTNEGTNLTMLQNGNPFHFKKV